ncbi:6,7-dimethyl-8-ribityllumazine synthase [Methanococcus maripaludis]|uniref:6,7-dimethyl-8-ribityllumazine synthase n=3 Tax=Methanococcus maripaludis TaxID=39152 RepID=RISB_METM6|nr:6,7-dimethyl-8-ribityllumazine synthase [Methanococcus maripaludis]A6VI37.1 RecName: Full=6,7-dimethyl-8-ribityllumazine synthase; Short=DMRL synthase; Short=LS; Short=Lumazine synthase [Methanococcus maripaludis C7]A9A8P1.1 RecName: Full=6,7-dimethyl-8-ribityllumazine synthase; Short=DMRL synthase; Short=LS; Short=Lumazine synthase [Methanococcus maripaludis C6]MBA2862620.1 6,7-dimethyl-8-ribityllumazine synthase [Methanococcus maripaludis]
MVKLGFVIAEFNRDLTFMMEKLAEEHAAFLGADVSCKIMVPGSFDMPLAIKTLLQKDDIDAVVTIGCVIEGDTEHDEIVVQNAARKIADLSLEFGKPVALGIAGPGMTRMQAEDRIDYGKSAVEAAVKMVKRLKEIQ